MNGQTKRLKTALVMRGHTEPLRNGDVLPRGFAFDFEDVPVIVKAFRRMVRSLDFDISEMAMTTYLCARAFGKPFTAIPVFPMRALHHGAILVNRNSGVERPKDLEGRKVGVNRGYTVTTGLWARAILQHEHGVDLGKITWVLSGDEHVAEYRPPSNVVAIQPGQTLEAMLVSGEIPAAVGVQVDSTDVRPLIPNAKEAGFAALRDRGFYPINHTVVIKDDLLKADPTLARDVFDAFAAAKRVYVQHLQDGRADLSSPNDRLFARVMEITGDPLPYGIEPNRAVLEGIIRYSVEQSILPRPFTVEELFAATTRALSA